MTCHMLALISYGFYVEVSLFVKAQHVSQKEYNRRRRNLPAVLEQKSFWRSKKNFFFFSHIFFSSPSEGRRRGDCRELKVLSSHLISYPKQQQHFTYFSICKQDFDSVDADCEESAFASDNVLDWKLSSHVHLRQVVVFRLGRRVLHRCFDAVVQVFALLCKQKHSSSYSQPPIIATNTSSGKIFGWRVIIVHSCAPQPNFFMSDFQF